MPDVSEIRAFLMAHGGEKSAQTIDPESGSSRIRIGIRVPVMREFLKSYLAAHKADLTPDAAFELFDRLYAGETLEEIVIAGMLLAQLPKAREALPLERFGRWLHGLAGWLEVDATCQSTFAPKELYARWDAWAAFLRGLNRDSVIAKRRASLVLLIRTVRESDDPRGLALLFELIEPLKIERDKLITKAISWVLREAVKRHKTAVAAWLDAHEKTLQSTIVREVRVKLATGKKR